MKYKISHHTKYLYADTASLSHNEMYLTPRDSASQKLIGISIEIQPSPSTVSTRSDYFGNRVTTSTIESPHNIMEIKAQSTVELDSPFISPDLKQNISLEKTVELVKIHKTLEELDAFQYTFSSPLVPVNDRYSLWARECFFPGESVLDGAIRLTSKIYSEFRYDPGATTASTPVETAFRIKKGVCQDFAHIELACLRSLGLPARYVSGYLHTLPPPGSPKLIGADASHAWVSIYIPETGWVDLDPTNNVIPSDQHLTLAWGRDYGDVTPVRGTVLGGGQHQLSVAVDVNLYDENIQA